MTHGWIKKKNRHLNFQLVLHGFASFNFFKHRILTEYIKRNDFKNRRNKKERGKWNKNHLIMKFQIIWLTNTNFIYLSIKSLHCFSIWNFWVKCKWISEFRWTFETYAANSSLTTIFCESIFSIYFRWPPFIILNCLASTYGFETCFLTRTCVSKITLKVIQCYKYFWSPKKPQNDYPSNQSMLTSKWTNFENPYKFKNICFCKK